jgi:hypothetical protein
MFRARIQPNKNLFSLCIAVHFFASFHLLNRVFHAKCEKPRRFKRNYQRFQPSFQHEKEKARYTKRKESAHCMDFYGNICLLFYFFQAQNHKKITFRPHSGAAAFEILQFGIPPAAQFSTTIERVFKMWKTFSTFCDFSRIDFKKRPRKFSPHGTKNARRTEKRACTSLCAGRKWFMRI